jgi:hypothetical protein
VQSDRTGAVALMKVVSGAAVGGTLSYVSIKWMTENDLYTILIRWHPDLIRPSCLD